ncbi:PAS domain S-box protein [Pleurocapsales cyanobacterium LEGE 10410]|nr:PAS domain S-box protein [Pleurocapsales cyanobacterium LEGE 10410]
MPSEKLPIQPFVLERVIDRNPPIVTTETTVFEAIALMSQIWHQSCIRASCELNNITDASDLSSVQASSSYLLVMEAGKLVGIFTERDLVKLAASEYDCSAIKITEVMTASVITLSQSEIRDIFCVLGYFRRHRIRHLPILDEEDRLLGVITTGSLRQSLQPNNFLKLRKVADVMATEVVTASANDSVLSLARLMSDRQVSCVVITEASEDEKGDILVTPVGIITEGDIVQFQALNLNLKKIQAKTVMSFPLFPVKPLNALWQAHLQMQQHRVRRLVVTGDRGELVGIVTQTSLLQILDPLEMLQELEDLQQIKDKQTLQLKQTNRQLQNEIAERKRLESALREANRALTTQVERQKCELGVTKEVLQQETEARQRSQIQRDRFFDLSLDLFCITGVDGYFKQINPAMEQVLGFSRSELLAEPFINFVHPDDRAATTAEAAKLTQGMDTISFENRYRCRDGSYKWLLWTGTFAAEEQLMYGSAKDITERKLAEAESQRQSRRSQLIAEITLKIRQSLKLKEVLRLAVTEIQQILQTDRVLVFQLHPDGSGTAIEEAVVPGYPVVLGQDIFDPCFQDGYAAQYLQGRVGAIADIEQANIQPCYVEFLQQFAVKANLVVPILQQSQLWGLLIVHQCDRPRHWQTSEIELLKQLANQISIAISQAELLDGLEEKVAERTVKLERADKRLKLTQFSIDRSAEIIAWVSPNGEIIYVNDSACDILGYSRDRLMSLDISEIIPAFSPAAWAKHWQQLRNRSSLQLETSLQTQDGRVVPIEAITEHLQVEEREYNCIFARDISQRKQTESALQQSQQQYKTLVNNVPGAIYRVLVDSHWTALFFDDEISTISGYPAADFLQNQRTTLSIIYTEDRERVAQEVQAALAQKRAYTIEHRIVRSDGAISWVKSKGQGVYDEEDRLLWLDGILLDINERKWAETLRQLQNQVLSMLAKGETLYDVLNKLTEGINQLSPDLNSTILLMEDDNQHLYPFANSQMPQVYVQACEHLPIGEKAGSCGTAAYLGQRVIVSDIASDPLWAHNKHLILPHGFQACWSEPIKSETGKVLGTFGLYFTEPRSPKPKELEIIEACASLASVAITRKQSEAALQNSESQLRLITDALPVLIAYLDDRQCYQFANKTAENWHRLPRTKIVGSHIKDIVGEVNYPKIQPYIESALSGNTATFETELFLSDRSLRHISATCIPALYSDGEVKGVINLVSDISDRKANERMKNEFISVVSHELRTPLTSIYGALKLLVTNPQSGLDEEDREMLDIAVTNTERLIRLVNDVLDLERIESGKIEMNQQPCDAADLIHQAIEVMLPMAQAQEITLVTEPISIAVNADRDHIHQTLTNLLSNAIKFSSPHSSVWLTVDEREREVLFKVSDRGRGIPSDKLERIFERFQQVDASDSRDKGGTGLGLAICYKIIEEHGGRIWAESQLDEGSTFCFTLPK